MSVLMLDTDVFLLLLRQRDTARELDARYGIASSPARPIVSAISLGEAMAYASEAGWRGQEDDWILQAARSFLVIEPHGEVIRRYGALAAGDLPVSQNDVWLVATAQVCNATLLTCDERLAEWGRAQGCVELVSDILPQP